MRDNAVWVTSDGGVVERTTTDLAQPEGGGTGKFELGQVEAKSSQQEDSWWLHDAQDAKMANSLAYSRTHSLSRPPTHSETQWLTH